MTPHKRLVGLGALTLVACRGDTLAVGAGLADAAGSGTTSAFSADSGIWVATSGSLLSAGPGTRWTGYLENYTLPSGSDVVTMTFNIASDGTVTGTTYFGSPPLLSPPTDPNVGYPLASGGDADSEMIDPIEHFPYTILDGHLDGSRLTFKLEQAEIWAQWCLLQTSYWWQDDGFYSCVPQGALEQIDGGAETCFLPPGDAGPIPMDCSKLSLCYTETGGAPLYVGGSTISVCACDDAGCNVPATVPENISFDIALTGTSANGTVAGVAGSNVGQTLGVVLRQGDQAP
jgi:hypothetical protein